MRQFDWKYTVLSVSLVLFAPAVTIVSRSRGHSALVRPYYRSYLSLSLLLVVYILSSTFC